MSDLAELPPPSAEKQDCGRSHHGFRSKDGDINPIFLKAQRKGQHIGQGDFQHPETEKIDICGRRRVPRPVEGIDYGHAQSVREVPVPKQPQTVAARCHHNGVVDKQPHKNPGEEDNAYPHSPHETHVDEAGLPGGAFCPVRFPGAQVLSHQGGGRIAQPPGRQYGKHDDADGDGVARDNRASEYGNDPDQTDPAGCGDQGLADPPQGKPDEALEVLAPLGQLLGATGRKNRLIEVLALRALAHQAQGDTAPALEVLGQALSLAEPEGYCRTFVDEGLSMAALLAQCLLQPGPSAGQMRPCSPNYVNQLLAAFPSREPEPGAAPLSPDSPALAYLPDPLNDREIEVLNLLAAGLTTPEMADRLILAPSTVKWHLKNIYSKLGVHRRSEAIAQARTLGLLKQS